MINHSDSHKPHTEIGNEERPMHILAEDLSKLKVEETSQIIILTELEEREIIRALYLADCATKLNETPTREPGTGEWVLNHKSFREWEKVEESALLWLSGNPCCGKTVISSTLIDKLKAKSESTLIYFFCERTLPDKRIHASIGSSPIVSFEASPSPTCSSNSIMTLNGPCKLTSRGD